MIIKPNKLNIEEYHAADAISSGKFRQWVKSPETYGAYRLGSHPDSKISGRHLTIGQAWEDLITLDTQELAEIYYYCKGSEPEKPSDRVLNAKKPSNESINKIRKYNSFLAEVGDRTIISVGECDKFQKMLKHYHDNQTATKLWTNCEYQMTIRQEFKGHTLQCRFDGINTAMNYAVDCKTTSKPLEDFNKAVYDYRYDLQESFYNELYHMQFGKDLEEFHFLVHETIYPFRCQVLTIPRGIKEMARITLTDELPKMITAIDSHEYPEFPETGKIEFSHWQLTNMGYEE